MELEYNTQREKLIISEYGRHIQKMVDFAVSLENKERRQKTSESIINLMGELNPQFRDVDDFKHKLWDHLFIISNFKLDVESPYPKPKIEDLFEKPEPLNYPNQKIKYNHYGKVIELMIEEAIKMDDIELKEKLVLAIANQMKRSYINWNLNSVDDKIILNQLTILSNQKLSLPQGTILHKVSPPPKQNQFKKKKKSNQRNHRNHSRN
jgi:hypothetical protein